MERLPLWWVTRFLFTPGETCHREEFKSEGCSPLRYIYPLLLLPAFPLTSWQELPIQHYAWGGKQTVCAWGIRGPSCSYPGYFKRLVSRASDLEHDSEYVSWEGEIVRERVRERESEGEREGERGRIQEALLLECQILLLLNPVAGKRRENEGSEHTLPQPAPHTRASLRRGTEAAPCVLGSADRDDEQVKDCCNDNPQWCPCNPCPYTRSNLRDLLTAFVYERALSP